MRKPPQKASDADSPALKNGWLGLAVIASMLIMAALVLLNLWLLRNEPVPGKSVAHSSCPQLGDATSPVGDTGPSVCENRFPSGPPQVTFYSKLMAPEDQSRTPVGSPPGTIAEVDAHNPRPQTNSPEDLKPTDRTGETNRRKAIAPQTKPPGSGHTNFGSPSGQAGLKNYTVQVGAFSHPGIAQQWATRWKARGYDASLRPVARPTGVIYRLYLGNFSSESQADELVRHLKSKEGISALRLVVRN